MSTDVVAAPDITRGAATHASLNDRIRYAQLLSEAGLVPVSYQGKPANTLYAIETGNMLGVHPIAALNGINVISGKPTISPALMTALVRRAGHKVRITVTGSVSDGTVVAACEVIRCDDPSFTYRAAWDIGRAQRANLWGGRGAWSTYPEAMLKARAIAEVCREAAEDALCGIAYVHEELGAVVDGEGEIVEGAVYQEPVRPQPQRQEQREPQVTRHTAADLAAERAAQPAPQLLDADAVRDAIFTAPSRASLRLAFLELGAVQYDGDGKEGWDKTRLEQLVVADADGQATNAWDLMVSVAGGLPADDPQGAGEDVHDAEVIEEDRS